MKAMIATLIGVAVVTTPGTSQDFRFRRQLSPGAEFAVRNIIGDVRVEGTGGREVEVTATRHEGRYGDPDDVEIRAVEHSGGVAICVYYPRDGRASSDDRRDRDRDDRDARSRARRDRDDDDRDDDRSERSRTRSRQDVCHRDGNWNSNIRNDTRVDFVVRVPAGLKLDLRSVTGDVIARDLRGAIDIGSVSGNVELRGAEGDVVEARSVSGDVTLAGITARDVAAETVSGDVTFDGPIDGRGSYDFKTLSGDLELTLPREPDATVSASTFSGRLDSVFPVDRDSRRRSRNRFRATWGRGTAQMDLQSFSGNIRIRDGR